MINQNFQKDKNIKIIVSDINENALKEAEDILGKMNYKGKVFSYKVDVTKEEDLNKMIKDLLTKVKTIDVWINNAGVNQPDQAIWEIDKNIIDRLIDIDLKGTILGSRAIMPVMIKQKKGQIYNVEGYGSNDATMLGLSIYGTAKRAVTYFTEALAKEVITFLHGEEEYEKALKMSEVLFSGNVSELSADEIEICFKGVPNFEISEELAAAIGKRMEELVKGEFPIIKHSMNLPDAVELFKKQGMSDKIKLCKYRNSSVINVYEIDGYFDYFSSFLLY